MALVPDNGAASMGGAVATTILVVEASASLYAAFCPSWFTVRSPFFHDQDARDGNVRAIRQGEAAASVLAVAMGAASSYLVRSPLPLAGSLIAGAVMVAGYEYSMLHPAKTAEKRAEVHPLSGALWPRHIPTGG